MFNTGKSKAALSLFLQTQAKHFGERTRKSTYRVKLDAVLKGV